MHIKNLFDLTNKTAIVTGSAKENGFTIAKGFLEAGAKIYFVDILDEKLHDSLKLINNDNACAIVADVTKNKDLENMVSTVLSKSGKIDILVNNVGITIGGASSENYLSESWNKTFSVNLDSVFKLCQLVGKEMINKKGGSIINVTSIGSELGFPENTAYVSSKGGLKMLTKALARDWAKYNIRVNNLVPGYIRTDMTHKSFNNTKLNKERLNRMMIKRWGEPEDLIGPAIFLASDASSYVTGIDLYVDGGWIANGL